MNTNELIGMWRREEAQHFSGWDFSYLDGRMLEDQAPWSYSTRAASDIITREISAGFTSMPGMT
ncbi:MAG: hypothetical protein QF713_01150 [Dehalococcoidales bacterium]|jgi:hypothetical protein|nr:hypothetical protein [Dehalococcoidales bacterium]|tara:strand:+ start:102 stop:293 length:192 start_codon:yes stop_codon:yes gene_type:complete